MSRARSSCYSWFAAGALLVLVLGAGCLPANPEAAGGDDLVAVAQRLRTAAEGSDRAYELLRQLTTQAGPRLAGSEGDRRAVAWAVDAMRQLGFENVRSEPVTVPHWERGENRGEILTPFPQRVVLAALGGSVATPDEGLTAPVLRVESLEALRALPAGAATGKIVFIDGRMQRTQDEVGYRDAVAKRGAGPSEAARKGAVAVLIRSAGTSPHRIAHTGGTRYQDGVPRIPAAALSNPDADLLATQVASGKDVTFRLQLLTRTLPEASSANVIGEVVGREKPEEIVLLGAHLDSWDLGTGAVDDGAGCAIMMGAAKLIAELPQRPRRTLRVVLFANEEFGLSGARAYAEQHASELARHRAAFESDLGAAPVWRFTSRVAPADLPLVERIASLLLPLGIQLGHNDETGGADLIPLRPARIPTFALWEDAAPYFDVHHTASDTLAMIDPAALQQNVAAHAILAYAVADTERTLAAAPEVPAGR